MPIMPRRAVTIMYIVMMMVMMTSSYVINTFHSNNDIMGCYICEASSKSDIYDFSLHDLISTPVQ